MSSAFSIALSSLKAQSEAINTTGNNLANMNTLGFKGSSVDFEDMISQAMGVGTGTAIGMGVNTPLNNQIFTQGSIQSSTSPLATAIQGNGFFVVTNSNNQQLYTRDGDFTINENGVLQTQTGETVQGWMASPNINTTGAPGNIVIPTGTLLPAVATQNMTTNLNLNAAGTPGTSSGSFSTPIQVVDSLGNTHNLTVTFTKGATANTWTYNVSVPGADLTNGIAQTTGSSTSGSTTVTVASTAGIAVGQSVSGSGIPSDATVTAVNAGAGTVTLSTAATATGAGVALTFGTQTNLLATPGTLTFNTDGSLSSAGGTGPVALNVKGLADGAANLAINWNLFDANGNGTITQYAQTSSLASASQDGTQAAQLSTVSIESGGLIMATFSNGQQKVEGQLALASIQNPDSLQNVGNNNFAATGVTASPAIGLPQSGGRGQILGGSLEGSNVDMATEFTNLIVYQSAYQASSRVITTADQMSQDLMNLIH